VAAWEDLLAAADKAIPGFRGIVLDAAEQAEGAVDWALVESKLKKGLFNDAATVVVSGWDKAAPAFTDAFAHAASGVYQKGESLFDLTAATGTFSGSFRVINPHAVLWGATRGSTLIVSITDQQRAAVRAIIQKASSGTLTVQGAARAIKQTVGLDPRRATALANFAAAQNAAATTVKQQALASKRIEKYAAKLRRARAEVIARTEVLEAANAGQQAAWTAALNQKALGQGLVKRWLLTKDDRLCPLCKQMVGEDGKGQQVRINEPFLTPLGPRMHPPMHPQCRCVMGLVKGVPTGKGQKLKTATADAFPPPTPYVPPLLPARETFSAPRSYPLMPEDPPEVLKLKTFALDPDGNFVKGPWLDVQSVPPWAGTLSDQFVMETALGGTNPVPFYPFDYKETIATKAGNYAKTVKALKQAPGKLRLVTFEGKQYAIAGHDAALAEWAKGEAIDATTVNLDAILQVEKPLLQVKWISSEGWGASEKAAVQLDKVFKPATASDYKLSSVSNALKTNAAEPGIVKIAEIDPNYGAHVTVGDVKAALEKGAEQLPTPIVIKSNGVLYAQDNNTLTNAVAAWAKGEDTIAATVVDIDKYTDITHPMLLVETTADPVTGLINIGGNLEPPFGLAKSTWAAIEKKGIVPEAAWAADAPQNVKLYSATIHKSEILAKIPNIGTINVIKVNGQFVSTSLADDARIIAARLKGLDNVALKVSVDFDPALETYTSKLKAVHEKQAAAKKLATAAKKAAKQAIAPQKDLLSQSFKDLLGSPEAQQISTAELTDLVNQGLKLSKTQQDAAVAFYKGELMISGGDVTLGEALQLVEGLTEGGAKDLIAKYAPKTVTIVPPDEDAWLKKLFGSGASTDITEGLTGSQVKAVDVAYEKIKTLITTHGKEDIQAALSVLDAKTADQIFLQYAKAQVLGTGSPLSIGDALIRAAAETQTAIGEKVVAKAAKAITLPPPAEAVQVDLDKLVTKQIGPQGGSNPGGLYQAPDGSKWYVKFYEDARQAESEVLANRIYADLGIKAPKSIVGTLSDGRIAHAAQVLENRGTVGALGGLTEAQANQVLDGFAADVLTGNWDAVGTGLDNLVVTTSGDVVRIDQGGTFLFRAKAGLKPESVLGDITEWDVFASPKNPYYKQVFDKAGLGSADYLGDRAVQQIDRILTLQKREGGWKGYIDRVLPKASPATRAKLTEILDARTAKLVEKRTQILDELAAIKREEAAVASYRPADTSGAFTLDQALQAAKAEPGRGSSFAWDGGDVELLDVRLRPVVIDGVQGHEFKFKLTEQAGDALERSLKAKPNAIGFMRIPKQTAVRGQASIVNLADRDALSYGNGGRTAEIVGKDFVARVHLVPNTSSAPWAFKNTVQIFIKGAAPTEARLAEIMREVGVKVAGAPSEEAWRQYAENAFLRYFGKGVSRAYTSTERATILRDARVKYGVTPADLVVRRGALDSARVEFTDAAWAKIKAKTGIVDLRHNITGVHGYGASYAEKVAEIFSGDHQAMLSTTTRFAEGIPKSGMSSEEDIVTGGADYFFTSPNWSTTEALSDGQMVLKESTLHRLDLFAHDQDRYGATNPHRNSAASEQDTLAVFAGKYGGEVMIRKYVDFSEIAYVKLGSNASRVKDILRKRGITRIGGRTLDQFFR
jgi:hypothetical protein